LKDKHLQRSVYECHLGDTMQIAERAFAEQSTKSTAL